MSIVVHIEVTLDAGYDELSDGELVNLALTHAGVDGFAVSYIVDRKKETAIAVCDCLTCPCSVPVKRTGRSCYECSAGLHCDQQTGIRKKEL